MSSESTEPTYVVADPVLSSAYHNFVFLVASFMIFFWSVKVLIKIRNLNELWSALKADSVVRLDGRDAYTMTRSTIQAILRQRSSYTSTPAENLTLGYYATKSSIKLLQEEENDDTMILQFTIKANVPSLKATVYVGLTTNAVAKAYAISEKNTGNGTLTRFGTIQGSDLNGKGLRRAQSSMKLSSADAFPDKTECIAIFKETLSIPVEETKGGDEIECVEHAVSMRIPRTKVVKSYSATKRNRLALCLQISCGESKTDGPISSTPNVSHISFVPFNMAPEDAEPYKFDRAIKGVSCNEQAVYMNGILTEMALLFGLENAVKETPECIVCMSDPVEVLLLPCRHVCLCKDCHAKCDSCPECRTALGAYMSFEKPDDVANNAASSPVKTV